MKVKEAIEYLKGQDLKNLEVGRYEVDDDFFFLVQEYDTKLRENGKLEAHREWIDIQLMVKGEEFIEIEDISRLTVKTEYQPDNEFYEVPDTMCKVHLTDGAYVVLYPTNGHMPGIAVDNVPSKVRKVVGKVRV